MKSVYLFDVDGTLTPARQAMTVEFHLFFSKWIRDKKVYFVSGSDYEKLKEQIPVGILESVDGVFGCMGNTLHKGGKNVFEKVFVPPTELLDLLRQELMQSSYSTKFGNHIERRIGMINFSVVGRNAPLKDRKKYHKWDKDNGQRINIAERINNAFGSTGIEATVGGEISIDVYPVGWDKSQVLKHIVKGDYVFFGDHTHPGGNDYALAKVLIDTGYTVYNVSNYEETFEILRRTR